MSAVPVWLGATTGQQGNAGQINQFLGAHTTQYLYAAVQTAGQTTAGAATSNTNALFLAQSFTTAVGQTAIGYVIVPVSTATASGSLLAPTTLSLYASSGGAPSGSALVSTVVTAEYANLATGGTNTVRVPIPLPVTGLTASTTYWLVLASAGNASHSYTWFRSNQASGASTSPTGSVWTTQTYGFEFQVFDQTASGLVTATWEDSGARWTATTYVTAASINQLKAIAEYTVAQGSNAYVQSFRSFAYSNGLLTKVA
ncbi:hypothetical protein [Streptacidiphilus sp. PAMC 29251]